MGCWSCRVGEGVGRWVEGNIVSLRLCKFGGGMAKAHL